MISCDEQEDLLIRRALSGAIEVHHEALGSHCPDCDPTSPLRSPQTSVVPTWDRVAA